MPVIQPSLRSCKSSQVKSSNIYLKSDLFYNIITQAPRSFYFRLTYGDSPVNRGMPSRGGRLLVSCVPMREQKNDEKGYFFFSNWAVRSAVII